MKGNSTNVLAEIENAEAMACGETCEVEMMDLGMPDEIAKAFCDQYRIEDMLKHIEDFDVKTFLFYKYNVRPYKGEDVTWRATAVNYRYGWPNTERQLTIRLSHNGYVYSAQKVLQSGITWHDRDGFSILDGCVLSKMPFMQRVRSVLGGAKCIIFYSVAHRRMDIRFEKNGKSVLMFCFHRGSPEAERYPEHYYF